MNIFVSPNVKLSQSELKEIGYKFSEFINKLTLLMVEHFFENDKDMEKSFKEYW